MSRRTAQQRGWPMATGFSDHYPVFGYSTA